MEDQHPRGQPVPRELDKLSKGLDSLPKKDRLSKVLDCIPKKLDKLSKGLDNTPEVAGIKKIVRREAAVRRDSGVRQYVPAINEMKMRSSLGSTLGSRF